MTASAEPSADAVQARPAPDTGSASRALGRAIAIDTRAIEGDCTHFRGHAHFTDELVGPPGRLHGGLHLAARTVSVMRALGVSESALRRPMAIDVDLGKAIPLNEPATFEGTLSSSGEAWTLATRFLDSKRLDASARSLTRFPHRFAGGETESGLDLLRGALAADPPTYEVLGRKYRLADGVTFVDLPARAEGPRRFDPFLEVDGSIGAAFACTVLDTLAAVGLAIAWKCHLFTVRASLELDALPVTFDEDYVVAAILGHATTLDSGIAPVLIDGVLRSSTRVPVAMVRRRDFHLVGVGTFDMHPVDVTKFTLGEAFPKRTTLG